VIYLHPENQHVDEFLLFYNLLSHSSHFGPIFIGETMVADVLMVLMMLEMYLVDRFGECFRFAGGFK